MASIDGSSSSLSFTLSVSLLDGELLFSEEIVLGVVDETFDGAELIKELFDRIPLSSWELASLSGYPEASISCFSLSVILFQYCPHWVHSHL